MTGERRRPAGLPGRWVISAGAACPALAGRAWRAALAARAALAVRTALAVRAALAVLLAIVELATSAGMALAVDPSASPATGGDVRTDPAAPGVVGDPLFAVLGVVAVAGIAVVATLVAIRLADRR